MYAESYGIASGWIVSLRERCLVGGLQLTDDLEDEDEMLMEKKGGTLTLRQQSVVRVVEVTARVPKA